MSERKLTPKQHTFVLAYLETGNATEAYRRAYDVSRMKETTIWSNASTLLRNSLVAERLTHLKEQTEQAVVLDRAGVLRIITELATADASQLSEVQVRCCRQCWGVGHRHQWKNEIEYGFALAEAMDRNAATIRAWERDVDLGSKRPRPDDETIPSNEGGYGFDVFAGPNPECPACLGEGRTTTVFKDTRKLRGTAKRLFAGVKQTKDGLEIKTRDQDAALKLLANEFSIGKESPQVQVGVAVNAQGAENVTVIAADPMEAARQYQELMKG